MAQGQGIINAAERLRAALKAGGKSAGAAPPKAGTALMRAHRQHKEAEAARRAFRRRLKPVDVLLRRLPVVGEAVRDLKASAAAARRGKAALKETAVELAEADRLSLHRAPRIPRDAWCA